MATKFDNEKFINFETTRRNGKAVSTPVWFVEENGILYIRTIANSGKVKRIRNNGSVRFAPCQADGKLTGDWQAATAFEVKDESLNTTVDQKLDKKYGLQKKLFAFISKIRKESYTILSVTPV